MQVITTTQLRTKSKELVRTLKEGHSVNLIHRSQIVGEIKPTIKEPRPLTKEDIAQISKIAQKLNLPELSYKQREQNYRKHLSRKYGQGLS